MIKKKKLHATNYTTYIYIHVIPCTPYTVKRLDQRKYLQSHHERRAASMWACRAAMSSLVGGFSLYLIDLWTSYVVEATTSRPAPVRIICRGWIDLPNNFIVLSPQTSCQILGNSWKGSRLQTNPAVQNGTSKFSGHSGPRIIKKYGLCIDRMSFTFFIWRL